MLLTIIEVKRPALLPWHNLQYFCQYFFHFIFFIFAHLAVVASDLLVGCLGAFVALLTLFPLHIAILFHVYLFAAFLRNIPALLSWNLNNNND